MMFWRLLLRFCRAPQERSTTTEERLVVENKDFKKWKGHTARVRSKLGLPAGSRPWSSLESTQVLGCKPSERQLQILDVAFSAHRNTLKGTATSQETKLNLWADLSQSIHRKPWSLGPSTPAQNSLLYSFEADTVVSGHAVMRGMGIPVGTAPSAEYSDAELKSIVGEMYSCPIVTMLSFAFYCWPEAEWWAPRV